MYRVSVISTEMQIPTTKSNFQLNRKSNLFRCFVQTNVNIYFNQRWCYFRKINELKIPVCTQDLVFLRKLFFSVSNFGSFRLSELLNSFNVIETSVGSSWLLNIKSGKNIIYKERKKRDGLLMLTLNYKQTMDFLFISHSN